MAQHKRCRFQLYVSSEYYRGAGLDVECELSQGHAGPHESVVRAACRSFRWVACGEGCAPRGKFVEAKLQWEDER